MTLIQYFLFVLANTPTAHMSTMVPPFDLLHMKEINIDEVFYAQLFFYVIDNYILTINSEK